MLNQSFLTIEDSGRIRSESLMKPIVNYCCEKSRLYVGIPSPLPLNYLLTIVYVIPMVVAKIPE